MAPVGVLALQGSFELHIRALRALGIPYREVRKPSHLEGMRGLILPGGESTTHHLMLNTSGLWEAIGKAIKGGLPVWGTCAGAILLGRGKEPPQPRWDAIEVEVLRNAYGRQVDSFIAQLRVTLFDKPVPGVFIRAPRFRPLSSQVDVLASWEKEPVMLRQGNVLITAFHPELTDDLRIHRWFLQHLCGIPLG